MKQTIYEIINDYKKLYEMAEDEETLKEFQQALEDTKESIDFSAEEKAFNYAKVCKNLDYKRANLEGQAEFLKKELENVNNKIKFNLNNKKRILNVLSELMDIAKIDKFKNEQFTIYHNKSISVEVTDLEKALEKGLATTEIKPNKEEIKKILKSGEELDFANLKETKFLIIK